MDYKFILPDRYKDVLEHLQNSFYVDETLNKSINKYELNDRNALANTNSRKGIIDTLDQNISVMAVCRDSNEICGVQLNGISREGDIEKTLECLDRDGDVPYYKISRLLRNENQKLNIFHRFNIDRLFENRWMSVDRRWRGQGIARKLIEKSFEIAVKGGFKIIKVDSTSIYSFNILKSLGYETLSEVRFNEYFDENGLPMFKVDPPNEKLVIMYKRL